MPTRKSNTSMKKAADDLSRKAGKNLSRRSRALLDQVSVMNAMMTVLNKAAKLALAVQEDNIYRLDLPDGLSWTRTHPGD